MGNFAENFKLGKLDLPIPSPDLLLRCSAQKFISPGIRHWVDTDISLWTNFNTQMIN